MTLTYKRMEEREKMEVPVFTAIPFNQLSFFFLEMEGENQTETEVKKEGNKAGYIICRAYLKRENVVSLIQ